MSFFHPTTLIINPDFQKYSDFIKSIPQRFKNGEGKLIYKGRNELRCIQYEGINYVIKSFRTPHLINRFVYGIFRQSKAMRSYENAIKLLKIGVGTPIPVGYINIRSGVLFDRSYFITLQSTCSHIYQELFENKFDYEEEVLREIGKVTARLHENGYAHKDYGRANILFEKKESGINIELVDLNRMSIGPLDINAGCKNLERLPATPQMHRWIAEEYAKARGFNAEECYRLMVAYRSTQPGKIDNKY